MFPASGDTRAGEEVRAESRGDPLELVLVDTYSPRPGGADAAERGYNPRLVLLALAMGGFAIGTNEFAAMALLPYFSTDLGVDKATASQAISAYALGVVVGAPLLAVLGARLPRRNMLIGLMLAYGIANIVVACSVSYHMMLIARFFCGLPHGAFFGVGSLLAASVVPRGKRTQAVARMMVGLTVATILGVPMANLLGEFASWRLGFGLVGVLAAICGVMVFMFAPRDRGDTEARPLRELSALGNRQVLLLTATGCVGFGGFFAIYTYMANMLVEVTHIDAVAVPLVLALFGVGMTVGTLAAGWAADRRPTMTCFGIMGLSVVLAAIYPSVTHNIWVMSGVLFLVGMTGAMGTVIQTQLMDVARDAQTLAAALNQSAFNISNALGPWMAAQVLILGYALPYTGYVGVLLGLAGIVIYTVTMLDRRKRAWIS